MMLVTIAATLGLAAAGPALPAPALAGSPASDAAQACLQGPQIDYFEVVGGDDAPIDIDFGGLAHGSDQIGPYVVASNHGDCVSFIAKNKGKGGGKTKQQTHEYVVFTLTEVLVSSAN